MNKILITGASGFIGKNLQNKLKITNFEEETVCCWVLSYNHDLRDKTKTEKLFEDFAPTHVIHLASKVAGLGGHNNNHYQFLDQNCLINLNVLRSCIINDVKNVLAISSIAAFPVTKEIIKEELLNTAPPHKSEIGYSLSKCLLDSQIQLIRQEYNLNYCNIIPVNVYGPHDNFDLETSHVIAGLIHKFYLAIKNNADVTIWGDGSSYRQFIFVEDLIDILINLLQYKDYPDRLILAHPQIYHINEIVGLLSQITGFKGNIIYDTSKPSGLQGRECSIDRLIDLELGPPPTSLEKGLKISWDWFNKNY